MRVAGAGTALLNPETAKAMQAAPAMFASLRGYRAAWLSGDLIAGIMLAAIALPEQLATAKLAGFPPEAGLYAFAAGTIAFAALGTNRFASIGADSTTAPIFAASLGVLAAAGGAAYQGLAGILAIVVGTILLVVGVVRAGWVADLLSVPVTTGFLAGISVHIESRTHEVRCWRKSAPSR